MVVAVVMVVARTGRVFYLSTARFAGVAATILLQDHAPREIETKLGELDMQGHRLVKIREPAPD
jgi:hypothetical protein